jgi:hypothetical protein
MKRPPRVSSDLSKGQDGGMTVSVILLTWNSERFVVGCINSIYKSVRCSDFEIIVVDNGSKDSTLETLDKNFPELQIIKNFKNRGVARARNQGIRQAKGEYVILLDIDTVLSEGSIDQLIAFMESHPTVGICAPQLLYADGTTQYSCRRFPLVHTKILRRVRGKWADAKLKEEYYDLAILRDSVLDVDYVVGACQVIRRSALDQVGFLDENIFYGPEDVDLCIRMHLKKWRVVCVSSISIVHHAQRITKIKLISPLTWKHLLALGYFFLKHKYAYSRDTLYRRISKAA